MHISLGNFLRHTCDVIGVNRSMKRECVKGESTWSIIKSNYKQMNDHNRIINCTMVYREAIGYSNVHKKRCGKNFLAFSKDTVRMKAWTIFCKRRTFVPTKNHRLCSDHFTRVRFNENLPIWSSMDTIGPDLVYNPVLFRTSLYTSTKKTKIWFCHSDSKKPAL